MELKYYPEDQQEDYGTLALKLPMNGTKKGSFFNMSRTTEEQAVSNYVNLLLTFRGERYMQPDFGIGIQNYLFEPNTEGTRTQIEFEIQRQSAFWLPYIINHKIDVRDKANVLGLNSDPENAIQIIITFSVTESGANRQIVIFQTGGRTNVQLN
jgi:phage baseplate assembly protein W